MPSAVRLARLISLILLCWAGANLAQPPQPLSLDHALARALAQHPRLAQQQAQAEAAARVPAQAGSLPDPELQLNALNLPVDRFGIDDENMTQLQIGVAQRLPFPGTLSLRREAAEQVAQAAQAQLAETELQLLEQVESHWWELVYLQQALAIIARHRDLLAQSAAIAQTEYRVGKGLQQDVLLAEVELSRLAERRIELSGQQDKTRAELGPLLGMAAAAPLRVAVPEQPALPDLPATAELVKQARLARPLLSVKRSELAAARSRRDLARRDYYPDLAVSARYGFRQGRDARGRERTDFASIMLSLEVPLYFAGKQRQHVAEQGARVTARTEALAVALLQLERELGAARADYRRWQQRAQLLTERLIPQARQSVRSMQAGYRADQVDFLNLARARVSLLEFEQQHWRALTRARQALTRLQALTGERSGDI